MQQVVACLMGVVTPTQVHRGAVLIVNVLLTVWHTHGLTTTTQHVQVRVGVCGGVWGGGRFMRDGQEWVCLRLSVSHTQMHTQMHPHRFMLAQGCI